MLMRDGEMQNTRIAFSVASAKLVPTLSASGSVGGTTMVTRSQARMNMVVSAASRRLSCQMVRPKPMSATLNSDAMNLYDCCSNLNVLGFGYRMDRMSEPFVVAKPERTTMPSTFEPPLAGLSCSTLVALYSVERGSAPSGMDWADERSTGHCTLPLTTGMDSPVSIDSFTTQPPSSRHTSHGTVPVVTSTTSPTTRSTELVSCHTPPRSVCTYDE